MPMRIADMARSATPGDASDDGPAGLLDRAG
jgi:hypothetical protein